MSKDMHPSLPVAFPAISRTSFTILLSPCAAVRKNWLTLTGVPLSGEPVPEGIVKLSVCISADAFNSGTRLVKCGAFLCSSSDSPSAHVSHIIIEFLSVRLLNISYEMHPLSPLEA